MADFAEEMRVAQVDPLNYDWVWHKIDLAAEEEEEVVSVDWGTNCSSEELCDALEKYGFDEDKVFEHFENYPFHSILLREEY